MYSEKRMEKRIPYITDEVRIPIITIPLPPCPP